MDEEKFHFVFMNKDLDGRDLPSEFEDLLQTIRDEWFTFARKYSLTNSPRWAKDISGFETTKFLEFVLGPYPSKQEINPENMKRINDNLRLIMITSRIRLWLDDLHNIAGKELTREDIRTMKENNTLPLYWLVKQWRNQSEGIYLIDSLTKALVNQNFPSRYVAFAQLSHARRTRLGVGRQGLEESLKQDRNKNERIKISAVERILDSAEKLLDEDGDDPGNFSFMPSSNFEIYLACQRMLTKSRLGSQKDVVGLADEIISELEGISGDDNNHEFEWQRHLLWYAFFAMIRVASAANDEPSFKDYTKKMRDLERNVDSPLLKEYYEGQQSDRLRLRLPQSRDTSPWSWPDDQKLYLCMNRWASFIEGNLDKDVVEKVSRATRNSLTLEKMNGMGTFGPGYGIFPIIHAIASGRANRDEMDKRAYQKLVIGTRRRPERRIRELLTEIEWARFEVRANPSPLSTAILEILCREVIYRMWFEVAKLPAAFHDRNIWRDTIDIAKSLLERIKQDIINLRHPDRYKGGQSPDFITMSIKELERAYDEDYQSSKLKEKLRDIITDKKVAKTNFPGIDLGEVTEEQQKEKHHFLGMPMGVLNQDLTEFQHMFLPRLGNLSQNRLLR